MATLLARMQLTQRNDGLSVILLVEGHDGSESVGIVIDICAVNHLEQAWRLDLYEHDAIVVARAVYGWRA